MVALRAVAAALLALVLVLPAASASGATVTDTSGDAAAHLDILEVAVASSGGQVTLTMALDDLDVAQDASYYAYRLFHDGVESLFYCNLSGDGSQLSAGACGIQATTLGLQQEESQLRGLPGLIGAVLAILLDSFVWQDAESLSGSTVDVPATVTADASADTLTFSASASDLGLAAGDVVDLLRGGTADCSTGACPTADTLGGGASFTVE